MSYKLKSKELSTFFLLVFISQLFLVTLVSFTMDSKFVSFDTELTTDGDFSDELDSSDEGDFSLLLEEELEKEYFYIQKRIFSSQQKRKGSSPIFIHNHFYFLLNTTNLLKTFKDKLVNYLLKRLK